MPAIGALYRLVRGQGRAELPATPETVARYLTEMAGSLKVATLEKRLAALSQAHQFAGYPSPTREILVRTVMRRAKGTAQVGKRSLLTADLRNVIATIPDTLAGRRDRAGLLLGFAGGFRRSEIVGADLGDLRETGEGLIVLLRRSKPIRRGRAGKSPSRSVPPPPPARSARFAPGWKT